MGKIIFTLASTICIAGTSVSTAAPAPVAAIEMTTIDPAKLAEATVMLDAIMPPTTREAMITSMVSPIMQNVTASIKGQADLQNVLEKDPEVGRIFDSFIARQHEQTISLLRAELPNMMTAMARAYARRFTSAQMADATVFFSSPSGRAYMENSAAVMADPDIAQWQMNFMSKSFKNSPAEIEKLKAEIEAYLDSKPKQGKSEKET